MTIASPDLPLVSIVVPAYNEGVEIAHTIDQLACVLTAMRERYGGEIVVVDDGSTDGSAAVLQECAQNGAIRLVTHARNRGCGAAIASGFAVARGAIVVAFDADMSYDVRYVETLVDRLSVSRAHMAVASPYAVGGSVTNVPFVRAWCSRWANRVLCIASGNAATTFTCMVRAYDARALAHWKYDRVVGEFNATLLIRALRAGAHIVEVPANLRWSGERRTAARVSSRRLTERIVQVFVSACSLAFRR